MSEIQSLARGLKILAALGASMDGVSITDLAALLRVDKGTASRLAQTLAIYHFAEQDMETRRYHLGSAILSLSRNLLKNNPLREIAKPYLHQLVRITGECAHLGIPCTDGVLYIDQVESPLSLRVNAEIGHVGPLHATALGKVLLAFSTIPFPQTRERYTDHTITSEQDLHGELDLIRKKGYAVDKEEYNDDVRCIAVPVFDFREKVIGSLGISGPSSRLSLEKVEIISKDIIDVGKQCSEKMRFRRE